MDHQNKIYDVNELVEGIMEFDSYLDDEYSVLHQVVYEHDFILQSLIRKMREKNSKNIFAMLSIPTSFGGN